MGDRLTLATATGLPLLLLGFHVAMGLVSLVSGLVAIIARKGGAWHRQSGLVFVYAMVAMGLSAVGVATYEGKDDVLTGALAAYLIVTAWTTVRKQPLLAPSAARSLDVALMLFAFFLAFGGYIRAIEVLGMPGARKDGVPAGMMFFMTTVVLLAAIGDARLVFGGGRYNQGTRRLARHLWRMCFGLFITTGSFVAQLVMMSFMPTWMRSVPVILVLGGGPLVVLVYWMWRVRLRQNLRGLVTAR